MLRYPGGKLRLQKKINALIKEQYPEIVSGHERIGEPFTGGGGSLINMAEEFPNCKFHINDANKEMFQFWQFFHLADEHMMNKFYDRIRKTPKPTVETYNKMFDSKPVSDEDVAFKILFLNKTSYGGYVTKKLPIGGKEQKSKWPVSVYWKPENIIKKIQRARRALKGRILSVNNEDCNDFIEKWQHEMDFVYADPPYIKYGKQWYNCDFDMGVLTKFREMLGLIPAWCVSIDFLKETDDLFSKDVVKKIPVKYTAKSLNKKVEEDKELVVFPKP